MNRTHNVLIVDPHPTMRKGIRQLLKDEFRSLEAEEAKDASSALSKVNQQPWDLIIVEVDLPGRSGLELLEALKGSTRRTSALVFSSYPPRQVAVRAIRSGASAYLPKDAPADELTRAVAAILSGKKYIQPGIAELLAKEVECPHDRAPHKLLSNREFETFVKIARGKSPRQIADELHLSLSSINTYRARILNKMGLHGNADLIRYAIHKKLV